MIHLGVDAMYKYLCLFLNINTKKHKGIMSKYYLKRRLKSQVIGIKVAAELQVVGN